MVKSDFRIGMYIHGPDDLYDTRYWKVVGILPDGAYDILCECYDKNTHELLFTKDNMHHNSNRARNSVEYHGRNIISRKVSLA